MQLLKRYWWAPLLLILLVYPLLFNKPYYHVLGFNVLLFAAMGTSWNILGGYTGYKSLGHSGFYGLGAYLVAIAANSFAISPLITAPFLALIVAIVAAIMGWIMLRAKGSAFVIATIAMLLIFRLLALNLREFTGGAPGLSQPLAPWSPEFSRVPFYYYALGLLIITLLTSNFIRHSRFGLGLLAIRDDEGKAEMVGVNTNLYKVLAFGISAYFIGIAGGVWSYSTTHISPVFAFDIIPGVEMILITMLGGLGTLWGPALGAIIYLPLSDWLIFTFESTTVHRAILGLIMMGIIVFLPRGILPTVSDWLLQRKAPKAAHEGARTMAAMSELEEAK